MLGYKVILRRNSDQKTVAVTGLETTTPSLCWTLWEDGNYSCDCNRELLFNHVSGEDSNSDEIPPCGSGKFSAIKAIFDNGEEILLDEETT